MQPPQRLQKLLAAAGLGSRRATEQLITAGRVTLNGEVATLGDRAGPNDRVELDGVPISQPQHVAHYLVNKPAGVLSSVTDPHGRPCVVDLVDDERRLYPIGRLDLESEGLIIVTNDGELAQLLTHPSHEVPKQYLAHVDPDPSPAALAQLRQGVRLSEGVTEPARVSHLGPGTVRITIAQGWNRQIRRMCEAVGCPVVRLVRVSIGPISDQQLRPGQARLLTGEEVRSLYSAAHRQQQEAPAQ